MAQQFNHHTDEARYAQSLLCDLGIMEDLMRRGALTLPQLFYYVNLCFELYRLSSPAISELFTTENGKLCVR